MLRKLLSVLVGIGTTLSFVSAPVLAQAKTVTSTSQGSGSVGSAPVFVCTPPTPFNVNQTPSNFYVFMKQDSMEYNGGKSSTSTFSNILSSVQSEVSKNMKSDASSNFNSPNISVSISVGSKGSITSSSNGGKQEWGSQLNSFMSRLTGNTKGSDIQLSFGSQKYDIYVPAGMQDESGHMCPIMQNQQYIGYTVSAINKFIYAVQEAVLAGSVSSSYNTFSIYPSSQVPVSKILKKDTKTGAYTIDGAQSGVNLNYSLTNFYNPILGDMKPSQVKLGSSSQSFLSGEVSTVSLSVSSQGNLKFPVSKQYSSFISGLNSPDNTFTSLKQAQGATGVGTFKTSYANLSVKPVNIANSAFHLVAPSVFTKSGYDSNYGLANTIGESIVKSGSSDIYLLVTKNYVYTHSKSTYTRLGSYADYSLDPNSLVFLPIKVNTKGAISSKGTEVGAVMPLWFKEAIIKVSQGSSGGTPEPTARLVQFGQDFSGKLSLDANNSSLFSVSDALDGSLSVPLRYYAFPVGANYKDLSSHKNIGKSPTSFQLAISFENTSSMKGFYIFLNDYYVDNGDLVSWLQSNPAKAKLGSTATSLYDYVTGSVSVTKSNLSYSQWERLRQIRSSLSTSSQTTLQSIIGVTTLVFGLFLIFYSLLLMMAYWFDIFNVLMDFSLVHVLTRGRLYPIASKDALDYLGEVKTDVKYVSVKEILILMGSGVAVGTLFIAMTPIIKLLVFAYFTIKSWIGGF